MRKQPIIITSCRTVRRINIESSQRITITNITAINQKDKYEALPRRSYLLTDRFGRHKFAIYCVSPKRSQKGGDNSSSL